jgi:virginiamycin A acetyltransferase
MIASDVTFIMNGANHLSESITAFPFAIFGGDWSSAMESKEYPNKGNTTIGNDVWIGYGATIMPGVTIGDGAIIAAKSAVTKDVEPYAIVGGNPSTIIRKRFSESKIKELLEIRWWDWPIDKITNNVQHLTGNRIDELRDNA